MTRRWPRLSDERFSLVTPAKAGAQVLNGSRAVRVISKANCGWLRPCTLGSLSFARPKERDERKGRPERAKTPCVSRPAGRSQTRRAHKTRLGLAQCSLTSSQRGCGTRRALRVRTATALGFTALNPTYEARKFVAQGVKHD